MVKDDSDDTFLGGEKVRRLLAALIIAAFVGIPAFVTALQSHDGWMIFSSCIVLLLTSLGVWVTIPSIREVRKGKWGEPHGVKGWVNRHSGAVTLLAGFLPMVIIWGFKYRWPWLFVLGPFVIVVLTLVVELLQRRTRPAMEKLWGIDSSLPQEGEFSAAASTASSDDPTKPPSREL